MSVCLYVGGLVGGVSTFVKDTCGAKSKHQSYVYHHEELKHETSAIMFFLIPLSNPVFTCTSLVC